MSALGQKQTSRPNISMSALPPKADILPLRQRLALFDHFVGGDEERLWDGQT
jgi:hypothetical protein